MSEEEKRELWKKIGYLQGFYDGQLHEIRQQIAYEKASPAEKMSMNMRDMFALMKPKPTITSIE